LESQLGSETQRETRGGGEVGRAGVKKSGNLPDKENSQTLFPTNNKATLRKVSKGRVSRTRKPHFIEIKKQLISQF